MGHINHEDLRRLVKDEMVTGLNLDQNSKPEFCEACTKAKSDRKPFPKKSDTTYLNYGEKVVADLWGPARVDSLGGNKYYSLFKDMSSREEKVYFLKAKSDALTIYKKYEAWVSVQHNSRLKIFGCDPGGEFTSKEFSNHLENAGTIRHLTVHDSPASNGAVERGNRTHLNNARAMMIAAGLPRFLWAEAIHHDVWLCNRAPTRALSITKTPYEVATGMKPDLTNLLEWGIPIWVKILDAGKLDVRADEVRFVGFDEESKGVRVYWPKQRKVSVERDIYVDKSRALLPDEVSIEGVEDVFTNLDTSHKTPAIHTTNDTPHTNQTSNSKTNERNTNEPDASPNQHNIRPASPENDSHQRQGVVPRQPTVRRNSLEGLTPVDEVSYGRGKRVRIATSRAANSLDLIEGTSDPEPIKKLSMIGPDFPRALLMDDVGLSESGGAEVNKMAMFVRLMEEVMGEVMIVDDDNPILDKALKSDERSKWTEAIDNELSQMEKVKAWVPIVPPPDANIIPSRYVLRRKRDASGSVSRHKARLVVKGFRQQFGIDYFDTFAPTVRPPTLRILLSFAAQNDSAIHQCDVKNAYLNSPLQDGITIYSDLPPKYNEFRDLPAELRHEKKVVCKWLVSVYGSKQGAHDWYSEVKRFFTSIGYTTSLTDEAVFYKLDKKRYTIVAAATDDFTVIAESAESANHLIQKQLTDRFEISDLGPINWLLGVNINRDTLSHTISLNQKAYIEQIIARFGLQDARPAITPMEPGVDLSLDSPAVSSTSLTPSENTKYREMIGCLMYATTMTRPDIAFAVSTLSQYLESPRTTHLIAVSRVFRYLSGTKDLKLTLGGSQSIITGYTDADWASQMHRHSISGFTYFVGTGAVNWSCKKQPIITLSSTEAEYVALTHASKDAIWIHKLINEFSTVFSFDLPTILHCDNQGAIRLSKDSTFHGRTKHIDVHFHFIRQTITNGHIELKYCPTDEMIADIFTKSLARVKFEKFRILLGLL